MKAAVITGLNSISVQAVDVPEVDEDSILMEVAACAVCKSDIQAVRTISERFTYPAIVGRQISGQVVEKGDKVRDFSVGDRLAVDGRLPCNSCSWCRSGMQDCCDNVRIIGCDCAGGFAQYCLLDAAMLKCTPLSRLTNGVNMDTATLTEPLARSINCFERAAFQPEKSLLVIGADFFGLMLIKTARIFDAKLTILYDPDPSSLKNAHLASCDCIINPRLDPVKQLMNITQGRGADFVFVSCPSVDAQEISLRFAAKKAVINFCTQLPVCTRNITLNSNVIHDKQLTITGTAAYTHAQHKRAADLISNGALDLAGMIIHTYPLEDIEKAFNAVESHSAIKAVVRP